MIRLAGEVVAGIAFTVIVCVAAWLIVWAWTKVARTLRPRKHR